MVTCLRSPVASVYLQLGDAVDAALAGEALVFSKKAFSSLIVSASIIVPQLIVAL